MAEARTYQAAFNKFKEIFLDGKKSIFSIGKNSNSDLLTKPNIEALKLILVGHALGGDASFIDKLKAQSGKYDKFKNDLKPKAVLTHQQIDIDNALELLAHAVWLWRLPPYSSKSSKDSRISAVKEILDLTNPQASVDYVKNNAFFEDFKGFASPGMYYYINKHYELLYIINFFEKYLDEAKESKNKDDLGKTIAKKIAEGTDEDPFIAVKSIEVEYKLGKDGVLKKVNQSEQKTPKNETCAMQNALLHLLDPDSYEPILSNAHKEGIVKNLGSLIDSPTPENTDTENTDTESVNSEKKDDAKIKLIRDKLTRLFPLDKNEVFSFYSKQIRPLWDDNLQPIELNTIYYGPPGTGKTYLARQAIEARVTKELLLEDKEKNTDDAKIRQRLSERIKQVQFHPSFTYEDFIDGLKPELINGQVNLKLTNGVFKDFCRKAAETLLTFRENNPDAKDSEMPMFYFIADEINRADLSSVLGEVLSCLEEDKRLDFDDKKQPTSESLLIQTKNSYLDTAKTAVCSQNNNPVFGIPKNLVFVGAMNDIDRSVDTFDFALRRRFTWIYKGFDIDTFTDAAVFKDKDIDGGDLVEYAQSCKALNDYITKEPSLGESFAIGHAYFFNIELGKGSKFTKNSKEKLFDRHLAPLLEEYLRASFDAKDIKAKIAAAKKEFIPDETSNKNK